MAGLEYRLSRPGGSQADGGVVAVMLHGRGSDMDDLQGIRRLLPPAWTLVTPRAPHAGAPWGYGPGWAWYRYIADDQVVMETLDDSLSALDDFLDSLPDVLGAEPRATVLGGFSQGGTTSMAYALTRPERLAAVLNFSGFLANGLAVADAARVPPIYWGHGLHDPSIPHALAVRGRTRLAEAGVDVTSADHPIGHGIVPDEIAEAVAVVERALA